MEEATTTEAVVIGGGLAGSEAAGQLGRRGVSVTLFEMRPDTMTPAHHGGGLAELVCSNSMKSTSWPAAPALLKRELEMLGSVILDAARQTSLPAGSALAVDREAFSAAVTDRIARQPTVNLVRREQTSLEEPVPTIVASGPLTSPDLEREIANLVGSASLYFYDAAAPLVEAASVDSKGVFAASRYGKGDADYLNCPMDESEYAAFYEALVGAERGIPKSFENRELFSACQPVEEIAARGREALRFGPMKPVGLVDPATGKRPHAVVQLRRDNAAGTVYNIVGFQTNLKWSEQDRVFRMIPGLAKAEFTRYGVMHRNTFIDSPRWLRANLALKSRPNLYFAGQITGGEGYLEAAATGLVAALNLFADLRQLDSVVLPATTAIGSLVDYATGGARGDFQPQHANLGLLPPLAKQIRKKKARHEALANRAVGDLRTFLLSRPDLLIKESDGPR